jgi:hypothetical protein
MILPKSPSGGVALRAVPGAQERSIGVSRTASNGTMTTGDEGMTADMIAKIVVLCGIALMLAGCAQPGLSCSGNGGANHNSGALCAGVIPLNW